jgi:hypothetical protein
MAILVKQKKLEISNGNLLKRIVEKNVAIKLTI